MQNSACHCTIKETLACLMTINLLPKITGWHGISKINNWLIRDLNNSHLLLVQCSYFQYTSHIYNWVQEQYSPLAVARSFYRPFTCERRTMYLTVVKECFLKTWQSPNGFPKIDGCLLGVIVLDLLQSTRLSHYIQWNALKW